MWQSFETVVPAKWVLTGEHSVLRGITAVAIPHPEFRLKLKFSPNDNRELEVEPSEAKAVIRELLEAVDEDLASQDRSFSKPTGLLKIESDIPIGAGLGSSAALCVALTRWMSGVVGISKANEFEFAKSLEHRFHGRSSGMDIAVTTYSRPISFEISRGAEILNIKTLPKFTFHDTGLRSRTSDCVLQVNQFREENPFLALKTDESMAHAARLAMEGLFCYDKNDRQAGLKLVGEAMRKAQECFYTWHLVPSEVKQLEQKLYEQGALAVKTTGAGGGGFLVALWE